tara:strand:+ start:1973 stop:3049 length:1077 start_codon:yes stop_codon:yes gene_type:complete
MNNKIVIDIRMIENSGIGTYIQNIIPKIINSLTNYNFLLLTNNKNNYSNFFKKIKHNNYSIITLKSNIYTFSEQLEIPLKLPKKFLLYWSPHYNIPILLNRNILVTIHDIYHLVDNSIFNIFRKLYCFFMLKIIKNKRCNIITVSNFSKKEILKHTKIKNNKITVIYNGLEKKWNSTNNYYNTNNILYVGNFKKHKNISLIIKSFINLKNKNNINLYIVGGQIESLDNESINIINNHKNIYIINYSNTIDLMDYYNSSRLYILASTYEGFGFTPLEAMACGCPVLASKVASIPEICSDGAFYFENNNYHDLTEKIEYLFNNKSFTDKLVQKGYEVSKRYSWKNTSIKTIKTLKNILSL